MANSGRPGERSYAEQLTATLAFAVDRIPWYREQSDVYGREITGPEDLAALPIIDRATVLADPRAFASSDEWPTTVSYSSSTTGGIGQPRWRSASEQQALQDLLADVEGADTMGEPDAGITLMIHPLDQGIPVAPLVAGKRVTVGLLVPWHFDLVHEILADGWSSPSGRARVTTLDGFSPGLRVLTRWFEQRGIDVRSFGVQEIHGYGSIQPAPWRRLLEQRWGARYTDLYGLSEVVLSDSARCPLCAAYHFPLPIVPEVVDLVDRTLVASGTGMLLLTELHPFAELQVLVRYWTDDIVELAPPCPLGGFGIFFRGRRSSSVVVERSGRPPLAIGSLQVADLVAELPDVAVPVLDWAPWATDVGAPRFALADVDGTVTVTLELRFDPALFPGRAAAVADGLRTSVIAAVTGLDDAVRDGTVDLSVRTVGPGALEHPVKV